MNGTLTVVRLGHRPGRDERVTTHVGLTARAFGADRVVLPAIASSAIDTVEDVTDRFGGPFDVEAVPDPMRYLRGFDGPIAHLTMYGLPVAASSDAIRESDADLAIVVGGGKVTGDVFDLASWNVAVGNQPHSEIAALAVFLDRVLPDPIEDREWSGGDRRIVPTAVGKRVERRDDC